MSASMRYSSAIRLSPSSAIGAVLFLATSNSLHRAWAQQYASSMGGPWRLDLVSRLGDAGPELDGFGFRN
jgi:hypothetical protein